MDVKEYISSGVLEMYVMGTLTEAENQDVEKMCASHPEIAAELSLVQDALNNYSLAHARNPDPALRTALMRKIQPDSDDREDNVQLRSPHELTYKYLIAACIASLIISTFASVFFYQKWSEAEDRNVVTVNEKNVITQNLSALKYEFDKMNNDLSIMRDPAMTTVTLKAADSTKYYMAHVFWNKYTRETFIDINDLPVPPPGKQYQLWAVVGEQSADAGVFERSGSTGLQKVKQVMQAETWTVTLEPEGGSTSPSMDQQVLVSQS